MIESPLMNSLPSLQEDDERILDVQKVNGSTIKRFRFSNESIRDDCNL